MTTSPGVPLYVCLGEANYVDGGCFDMLARCVQVIPSICFAYAVDVTKEETYIRSIFVLKNIAKGKIVGSRGNYLLNGSCRIDSLGVVIVCSDVRCFL
jgi:hypothetical protein